MHAVMEGRGLVCCVLLLLAGVVGVRAAYTQPHVDVTGHERPLLRGLQQDLTCTAVGIDVASIEWQLLYFGYGLPLSSASNVNELVLSPNPSHVGRHVFQCVVIGTTGDRYVQEVPFTVKELEHSVGIRSSIPTQVKAGGAFVLTCESVSDRLPHLTWVGPNGTVTSGNGITVFSKNINESASQITLAFHPLRTSHAGRYTCISNVEGNFSVKEEIHIVSIQIPEPEVTLIVGSDGSVQTTSLDHFTVSCLIKVDPAVDTPVEVEAVWSGNPSLSGSPHVAVQPLTLGTPYLTSITFTSITPRDLGEYKLAVRVGARSGWAVIDSSEVHRTASINIDECTTDNGGCEHDCLNSAGSYECQCNSGYLLNENKKTCTDIDECSDGSHICEQECDNTPGSFTCSCTNGYNALGNGISCIDIDECSEDVDNCAQLCFNTAGSFTCSCQSGYRISTNDRQCTDINECSEGSHNCDQTCSNTVGSFTCSCRSGYTLDSDGRTCIDNIECNSNNGGCQQTCVNTAGSYHCECRQGYRLNSNGRTCTDINECSSSSLHGCEQLCVNTEGAYGCACRDGYALDSNNGRTCSLDCGGRLTGTSGSFHTPGWPEWYPQLDFRCVWTVDSIPEQHSAVFIVDDSAYGINGAPPCRTDYIEFFDSADHNWASLGKHCRLEVPDPVRIYTDGARVVFQGRRNSNRPANRVGTRVFYYIDENECLTDNGGCEGTCTNTYTSYVCSCRSGLQLTDDRHSCEDADECELNTHECDQLCINRDGYHECECQEGFYLAPNGKLCIPTCGGHFDKPNGTFHTPGWPDFYPELEFFCEWTIDVNNTFLRENRSSALQFTFDDSAYGLGDPSTCYQDYIEFYNDIDSNAQLSEKICSNTVPSPFTIISTRVKIVFKGSSRPHTDGEVGARVIFNIVEEFGPPPCSASEVLDFNGDCRSVECGGTLFAMSGVLQPPNWPSSSLNVVFCQWAIVLPDISKRVKITLEEIDISRDVRSTCFWNYVTFFDTTRASGIPPQMGNGRFCGTRPPNPLVASGNIVNIWYQSRLPPNRGFSLSFSAV